MYLFSHYVVSLNFDEKMAHTHESTWYKNNTPHSYNVQSNCEWDRKEEMSESKEG